MEKQTHAVYNEVQVRRVTKVEKGPDGDPVLIHYSFETLKVLRTGITGIQIGPMEMLNHGQATCTANEIFTLFLTDEETPAKYNYTHTINKIKRDIKL